MRGSQVEHHNPNINARVIAMQIGSMVQLDALNNISKFHVNPSITANSTLPRISNIPAIRVAAVTKLIKWWKYWGEGRRVAE
jgi:hypothetical protein